MNAEVFTRVLGDKVRRRRLDARITQKDLADAAGISVRLLRDFERGLATGISLERLIAVLSALDLSLAVGEAREVDEVQPVKQGSEYSVLLQQQMDSWLDAGVSDV